MGGSDYQWFHSDWYDFIEFDVKIVHQQRRYATVINGTMIYIIMETDGPITEDEIRTIEAIVRTFREE